MNRMLKASSGILGNYASKLTEQNSACIDIWLRSQVAPKVKYARQDRRSRQRKGAFSYPCDCQLTATSSFWHWDV